MSFSEICIYQVKPDKVDGFESIMNEAKPFLEERAGLLQLRLMKRGYKIDMEQIREGLPPVELTRIVKCVKYIRDCGGILGPNEGQGVYSSPCGPFLS